jgi:hypothetical protein
MLGASFEAPSLRLSADLKNLTFQENTVATLQLRAFVPNVRASHSSANVAVTIPVMHAGGRSVARAFLAIAGAWAHACPRSSGWTHPNALRAVAEGSWRSGHQSVVLDRARR